jgi:hypothetical protein
MVRRLGCARMPSLGKDTHFDTRDAPSEPVMARRWLRQNF